MSTAAFVISLLLVLIGAPEAGRYTELGPVSPTAPVEKLVHSVDGGNRLTSIYSDYGSGPSTVEPQYDAAGNLVFDGEYFYQYDAWNRLVQVNRASVQFGGALLIEELVKHSTYDGLGRLVRTQSPYPEPGPGVSQLRSERFYYDGIRRIQEVVTDPVKDLKSGVLDGDPELAQLRTLWFNETEPEAAGGAGMLFDEDAAPLAYEQGQMEGGGATTYTYLKREYVWGPGDGPGGVDELLVQYDDSRAATWVLQDAGGDVVALCDLGGAGGTARVVGQWSYDAYGAVLSAEQIHAHPRLHAGHKGLFVDRLDVGVVDGGQNDTVRLVPYAHAVYQVRNRAYVPALGRFLQPDPNASAMALIESSAYHGHGMGALSLTLDMEGMYGDGMNLYEYLGSNPWQRSDPLGLSWDPFSIVDDYLAESTGAMAAMLSALGKDLAAVAVVAAQIASYLPFPFVGNIGELALYALGEQSEGDLAIALGMGLVPGGKLAQMFARSNLGKFLGGITSSAWKTATHYASKAASIAGKLGGLASGLVNRVKSFWGRKGTACGCFAAGTVVWAVAAAVPIEEMRVDDLVMARDEATGELVFQTVEAEIVTHDAALLELFVEHPGGRTETILTTDEHPFWVRGRGWARADALEPGQVLESLSGGSTVLSLSFSSRRTTVYNLTVDEDHNYFVGSDGVWVHNAKCSKSVVREFATKFWGLRGPVSHPKLGKRSHGEEWFTDGKEFFTFDNTHHRGGVWKVFDRQGNRLRTIDLNGEVVGK